MSKRLWEPLYFESGVLYSRFLQTQAEDKQQVCNGMYSMAAWGGSVDPFILTTFDNSSYKGDEDAIVSFVIFEWRDEHLLGITANPDDIDV